MWTCPKCREKSDDSFEVCWSCGTAKDGTEDPGFRHADAEEAVTPAAPAPRRAEAARCGKCGSERVVPRATIWDQGDGSRGSLTAYVYASPDALLFKGTTYATLFARICADCGHAELFAEGAEELYRAYREAEAKGGQG